MNKRGAVKNFPYTGVVKIRQFLFHEKFFSADVDVK